MKHQKWVKQLGGTTFLSVVAIACGASAQGQCTWTAFSGYDDQPEGAMVYDSAHQRVLYLRTAQDVVTVFTWNGAQWVQLSTGGPQRRSWVAAAYDSARNRVVMFGGWVYGPGGGETNSTWEWDGTNWTTGATGPQSRHFAGLAYDSARQRTVMFGGISNSTMLADTWEWDGQTWAFAAITGPSARSVRCMAFDSNRQRAVLYGGSGVTGQQSDVWEWDGATWSARTTINVPGTTGLWMVFDPGRGKMILGRAVGDSFSILPRQTWELDTTSGQWSLRDPGTAAYGPCAFDGARGRAVAWTMEYNPLATTHPAAVVEHPAGGMLPTNIEVTLRVGAVGTPPLTYQWRKDGIALSDGGTVSGARTDTLVINPAIRADSGSYRVEVSNSCSSVLSQAAVLNLQPICYPNCDDSTATPMLTANDFQCFLNAFAAGDMYANCDGSVTQVPIFTANDFQCFLNKYAFGCP